MGHYRSEMWDPSDDDPELQRQRAIRRMEHEWALGHALGTGRIGELSQLGEEAYIKKYRYGKKDQETKKD